MKAVTFKPGASACNIPSYISGASFALADPRKCYSKLEAVSFLSILGGSQSYSFASATNRQDQLLVMQTLHADMRES